jgi:hypothetical protein
MNQISCNVTSLLYITLQSAKGMVKVGMSKASKSPKNMIPKSLKSSKSPENMIPKSSKSPQRAVKGGATRNLAVNFPDRGVAMNMAVKFPNKMNMATKFPNRARNSPKGAGGEKMGMMGSKGAKKGMNPKASKKMKAKKSKRNKKAKYSKKGGPTPAPTPTGTAPTPNPTQPLITLATQSWIHFDSKRKELHSLSPRCVSRLYYTGIAERSKTTDHRGWPCQRDP